MTLEPSINPTLHSFSNNRQNNNTIDSLEPPPYSLQTNYNNNNNNILSEAPAPTNNNQNLPRQSLSSYLDLKLLSPCSTSSSTPYLCCSILENRFLLLGHTTQGIQVYDLNNSDQQQQTPKTILWIYARQIKVLQSSCLLLVLPDKMKKIRCYSLNAIVRLCYGVFNLPWSNDLDEIYPLPSLNDWELMTQKSSSLSLSVSLDKLNLAASRLSSSAQSALNDNNENNNNDNENSHTNQHSFEGSTSLTSSSLSPSSSSAEPLLKLIGSSNKRYIWKNKVVLQDYIYKLPNSRDTISIHTYQTSAYIFVALLNRDRISLYQRRRDNVKQLLQPLKEFWIPAETQNISFADDRTSLRYISAVFPNGAALIELQSSKVKSIPIDSKVEQLYETAYLKQIFEKTNSYPNDSSLNSSSHSNHHYLHVHHHQHNNNNGDNNNNNNNSRLITSRFGRSHSNPPNIPISQHLSPSTSSTQQLPSSTSSSSNLPNSTFNSLSSRQRQYNYTSPPTIQFTSLLQLPYHPKNAPSVTPEYSIPPSYTTVMERTPFEASDPIPLPSEVIPQLYFATFGCHSMIIDMKGSLFTTQVYSWLDPPDRIVFLKIQPEIHLWCAIGFTKESVLIMDLTTGTCQRLMNGIPVRFLGKISLPANSSSSSSSSSASADQIMIKAKKKDAVLWSCNNGKSHQVYYLSSLDEF